MIPRKIRLCRHCQFVFAAVQCKRPVDLYRGVPFRLQFSANAVRPETDFAELFAFEYFLMHFSVPPIVVTFSAGGVDNDFSARFPCRRIDLQSPLLQSKSSVHRVQRTAKRPVHVALRRIDPEDDRAGRRLRRGLLRPCDQHRQRKEERSTKAQSRLQPVSEQSHVSPFFLRLNLTPQSAATPNVRSSLQETREKFL